jgi:ATP-binding cassette subfamily F protein 3
MIICSLQSVTLTYGAETLFNDLSCEIKQGERIGLIGRNGEGKTSLLKLMAGHIQPGQGLVTWKKGLSIGFLEQMPDVEAHRDVRTVLLDAFQDLLNMKQQMAALERRLAQVPAPPTLDADLHKYGLLLERFQQQGGYEIEAKIERVATGLHIAPLLEKKWGQLSGGERTKVGLAKLLLKEPDFLLLDEPTNHLDVPAIEWLTDFLNRYHGTMIIVSHDRYFLDEVATKVFELEQGALQVYHGNYTRYVQEKEERILREFQQYQDQQKKIKKMKETIKRLKEWANRANPPNAGMHRRAKSMEKALARIEVLKKPIMDPKKIRLDFSMDGRSGKDVVVLEDVSKRFGDRELFSDVNMNVRFRERVAIVGENGSGKTTLLNIIMGAEAADGGRVVLGSGLSIGYLSQHTAELDPERTVLEEFRDKVPMAEGDSRMILARFLFYGNAVFRKVKDLSGGERMRLRLAQLVHQRHNLLILDEPTNHLDIDSREAFEEALMEYPGTVIAVSHDRYFLDRLFDITYWIAHRQCTRYEGNYTFAREKRRHLTKK